MQFNDESEICAGNVITLSFFLLICLFIRLFHCFSLSAFQSNLHPL